MNVDSFLCGKCVRMIDKQSDVKLSEIMLYKTTASSGRYLLFPPIFHIPLHSFLLKFLTTCSLILPEMKTSVIAV